MNTTATATTVSNFDAAVKAVCALTVDSGKVYPKAMGAVSSVAGGVKPPAVVAGEIYDAAIEAAQAAGKRMKIAAKNPDKGLSVNELKAAFPALKGLANWKGAMAKLPDWAAFEAVKTMPYPQLLKAVVGDKTGKTEAAPEAPAEAAAEAPAEAALPDVATLADLLAALEADAFGVRIANRAGLAAEIRALLASQAKPKAARKARAA